ncbi:ATP-binding protein [Pseudomonas sp. ITA]|uniref:ATP-binding protein n=1 Tax=Pseudomonas sp. ITA TaxID=2825841 RepID=UPI002496F7DE|nr:ATP-binding protein [Pseudomonas sp. ITA]MDI2146120.1 ATP-binding protein [Pseudomonas sp. ITA]
MSSIELMPEHEMSEGDNYLYTVEHLKRIDKILQLYLHQRGSRQNNPDHDETVPVPAWLQRRLDTTNLSEGTPTHRGSRLGQLTLRFSLRDIERDVLLLALLPHFDAQYSRQLANIQGSHDLRFMSVSLVLDLLGSTALEKLEYEALLLPDAPLRKHHLIDLTPLTENDRGLTLVKGDVALYHYLIGHDYLPPVLEPCARWSDLIEPATEALQLFSQQLGQSLAVHRYKAAARVTLKGALVSHQEQAVTLAADQLDMPCLVLDLNMLAENHEQALHAIDLALREVQLRDGCLVLEGLSTLATSRKRIHALFGQKTKGYSQPIVILQDSSQPEVRLGDAAHIILQMPPTSQRDSLNALTHYLDPNGLDAEVDLLALSNRFCIAPDTLEQTLEEAQLYRRQRNPAALLGQCDLVSAFKHRSQQNFGDLALRIEPKRTLADLMLPDDVGQQLNEVLMAIRHRQHAIEQGFGQKLNYGLGISALLHGPSGAGKTMAAEVLASALSVDLIKVDLSTVVNKYVGETEKHLAKIFDLAARDSGVLFFDEADALFGKRSETKDAQDRYANIEVSYLLQRLENHSGLVILSTNNLSHLDNAFTRRFTFIIKFLLPDVPTRARMWKSVWPAGIRIAKDVDFHELARLADVSGANIKNVALLATWLAFEEAADEVNTQHIRHALKREMTKTGQVTFQ